ncbi:MAG TPA: InlB B-repeat-containing protein, partial [Methanocorpusculum sp.]|nr:InlB B-repeat-containing protein [Methanocorpusculum sp.]
NTNYPAVDWESIADGTVAVAYTHQNGDFPAAHVQHEVTHSTDGTTWLWQHHLETSHISTFQNDPVMIEIFPEGSTTAAASHTEFYGGNWAYLGTVGQTQSYIIEATAGPNGSITPSGEVSVAAGSDQPFTFTPDDGYTVAEVRVDDEVVAPSSSYTFTNVQADHPIHVTFPQNPTPPAPIPPSGGGSSDGNMDNAFRVLFNDGTTTLFVVTDLSYGDKLTKPEDPVKDGYTFAGWHKDAACTQAWDFADGIAGDMTLYAKWTPVQTVTPTVTPTATASVTPTVTAEPTGLPTTTPTVQPTGEDDGGKPAGTVLPLIGGILILILAVLLLLFLLLRHTVTFLIPTGGEITEHRIKVWHGRYIDPADLPELLRTAAWYRDPARQERWDFNEDRVTKSIELYIG